MATASLCLKCGKNRTHWRYTVCAPCLKQARKSDRQPVNFTEGIRPELFSTDEKHFIYGR